MRVSVIIPTMPGRENVLVRAIKSVQEVDLDCEIVVAAKRTGSAPESFESKLSNFQVKLVLHDGNGNAASNRNVGIDQSSGEYIAFLDDDDEFTSGKLATQINAMENVGVQWSFSNYWLHEEARDNKPRFFSSRSMLRKSVNLEKNCAIATPTVIVKRNVLQHNDLKFNSDLQTREDIDLWTKLLKVEPVLYIPQALAVVHRSSNSAFQKSARGSHVWKILLRSAHGVSGKLRKSLDAADIAKKRTHIIALLDQNE